MYKRNCKARVTKRLFEELILNFDKELQKAKTKVLLILDDVSSHVSSVHLKRIKLLLLTPNTISKIQLLDQGIIHSFKDKYQKVLVKKIVVNSDVKKETKMDFLKAIYMINKA